MGLLGMRRHHLQARAAKIAIQDHRREVAEQKCAAVSARVDEAARQRAAASAAAKLNPLTPEAIIGEFEQGASDMDAQGKTRAARTYRDAAELVRRMNPDEFAAFKIARAAGRISASAAYLARRLRRLH